MFLYKYLSTLAYLSFFPSKTTSQTHSKDIDIQNKLSDFQTLLSKSKNTVVLIGEGLTHKSGYFECYPSDDWRQYAGIDLQTEMDFMENPSTFWELYQHRRNCTLNTQPKKVHKAIANVQKKYLDRGLNFTVATLQTDELLQKAGVQDVIELKGSIFKTRCLRCSEITSNYDNPITKCSRGEPEKYEESSKDTLPHCKKPKCGGILRPYVWWHGDPQHENVWDTYERVIDNVDFYITMGVSSLSPPIRTFFDTMSQKQIPTAEFGPPQDHHLMMNDEFAPSFMFKFQDFCEKSVPPAFELSKDE
ncbi:NAD-dependent protein deacylase-like isoform X2 [Planococcus citri]|uniref:NAD-dependent protein deacylase-like isoform X2 n=1 Tax=Planococcus citri TaxID=170843 RepID=UPI0031F98DF7